jgi:hypothetical protein
MPTNDRPDPDRDAEPADAAGAAGAGPGGAEPVDANGGGAEPSGTEQALRTLEERLGRASQAAERLIAEAAGAAARGIADAVTTDAQDDPPAGDAQDDPAPPRRPPPAGWAPPESDASPRSGEAELLQFVRSLRGLIPPDLQRRLAEAVRELLLALRALIDWYLERVEQRRGGSTEVQDIPIL